MSLKSKIKQRWQSVIAMTRRIIDRLRGERNLTREWDSRSPYQVFRQQRGLAMLVESQLEGDLDTKVED
ncbi:uncharacterized protein EV420DRAFT_1653515 [Desarmillaria tabescens]|uniref:Uncharacterized protein n=1 Tax=Armillaria tabescens TaxID=1929756 RepID=A0AA39J3M8_ARMTA|nr:uncharacterized protein EV420DRAFT_1653515 [Desarmillaria tabescens]KAK0434999.1 hypothetical protein EV420DRAFT_1653515 [Desarmillaria tabescens]